GIITLLFGQAISISTLVFFFLFSASLSLVYLSIDLLIGAIAKNRWHSLVGVITVWYLTIIIWQLLMISILSQLPTYNLVQPTLQTLTVVYSADFVRVCTILRIGVGSALDADYDQWITWATSSYGLFMFIGVFLICIHASIFI